MTAPEPVRGRPCQTALSVVAEEAVPLVADFRRRFHRLSVAKRIPPHVTLLYPFADAHALDDELVFSLRDLYGGCEPFDYELDRVGSFDGYVWLAPEPRDRFVELIDLTCRRFPEHPPYGGAFPEPAPHLTIGEVGDGVEIDALVSTAATELGAGLPLRCRASFVSLLEERPDGTWALRTRLPVGAG